MTDKEINLIQDTKVTSYADGWIQAYKELLQFIDSLPEEPASEDVEIQNCNTKEEVNDTFCFKVALILSKFEDKENSPIEQIRNLMIQRCCRIMDLEDSGCEVNFTTKNEDLEEEISKWRNHYISALDNNLRIDLIDIEVTAKHFAHWQHGKDFDDLLQSDMEFPKEYYAKGKADAMQDFLEKAEMYLRTRVYYNMHPNNLETEIEKFKNYMQDEM